MSDNNEQLCPFWKEPCSKVCPTCPLYISIAQQKQVLGVMKVTNLKMCYFPASAMIMSSKPQAVKQPPTPLIFGSG